jgi:hypothetical protein
LRAHAPPSANDAAFIWFAARGTLRISHRRPEPIKERSLVTLKEKLIKIGALPFAKATESAAYEPPVAARTLLVQLGLMGAKASAPRARGNPRARLA